MKKKKVTSYRAEHFDAGEWRSLTGETSIIKARAAIRQAGQNRDSGLRIICTERTYEIISGVPQLRSESASVDFEI